MERQLVLAFRSNLRNHIKSKHSGALHTFDKLCKEKDFRRKSSEESNVQKKASLQDTIRKAPKLTQKHLDLQITQYVVDTVLPFNHIDSVGFHKFVKSLAPTFHVKSQKVYAAKVDDLFQSLQIKIKEKLAEADYVCLTIDHWTTYRKGYIGFTAHWYTNDLVRKHACIALRRVTGRCTFNVVAKVVESVIIEYQLIGKVNHCVTDSGSNFVKAFAEFGSQTDEVVSCVREDADVHVACIDDFLCRSGEDNKNDYNLPAHFKCAAHRLNLIATKSSVLAMSDVKYGKIYRSLMAKLSAIWNKQSMSVVISDGIRQVIGKLFVVPNNTRWNSTFDALTRANELICKHNSELAVVFNSVDIRPVTDIEQSFLIEFLNVMRPLAYALDILQGEDTVSAGFLLPTIVNIQEEWKSLITSGLVYCGQLVFCLREDLVKRFNKELKSPYFKVAASLHPKFRLNWVSEHEKEDVTGLVHKALSEFEKDRSTPTSSETLAADNTQNAEPHSFFWRFEKRARHNEMTNSGTLASIWIKWCNSTNDLPKELYKPFLRHNTTLPSSAAVERLFSLGKKIKTPTRNQLSDCMFEKMIMLAAAAKE